MNIEAFDTKIKSIKDELNSLNNSILSGNEKINKIKELQEKTNNTKEELEKEMSTLSEEEKEKAQAQLDTLNELISFELLLYNTAKDNNKPEQSGNGDKKEGFFSKTKDWIGSQRSDIWSKDKRKDETGKNLLRSAGFIATGGGAIALVVGGIKRLVERRREKKAAETATQTNPENPETEVEQENKPGFRKRPFGKVLKRLGIGSAVAGGTYVVGKRLNRRDRLKERRSNRGNKDNTNPDTEVQQEFGKEELGQLSGFENECKELINQANSRRKLASKNGTDYVDNAKEYRRILNKALYLQTEALEIYDKIFNSNESSIQTKNETDNLKNSIDSAVRKIYQMKDEVFQNVPEGTDLGIEDDLGWSYSGDGNSEKTGNSNGGSSNPEVETPNGGEEAPETFEYISGTVLTQATMDYFETTIQENIKKLSRPKDTRLQNRWEGKGLLNRNNPLKDDIKKVVENYFKNHKILKKSASNKMIVEIDDIAAFGQMINNIFNTMPEELQQELPFDQKSLENLGKTLRESEAKSYENIVFEQFGSIIRNAVIAEKGTMTVQSFYDNIKKYYPNKNETQIDNDLKESGQAGNDIKYMTTSRTHEAEQA